MASVRRLNRRHLRCPNACGIYTSAPALETTREQIDSVMAVNLFIVFFTAQGYSREMVSPRSGSIVAIGSISGRFPRMGQIAYGAAEAGMRKALSFHRCGETLGI